jgi:ATP-dependent Clp protease, protease subunit
MKHQPRQQEAMPEELLNLLQPSKYYESYIRLAEHRAIFLTEEFSKELSAAITAFLMYYDHQDPKEDITIYINSNGGDASSLLNIYDVMQMIEAPVSTVCLGEAYSAGAFLLAAGAKGKRFAMPSSEIMVHSVQVSLFPMIREESSSETKNYLNFLNKTNDGIMKLFAKHTGQSISKVRKDCEKDFYLSAKEALKYGIIDGILL